MTTANEAMQNYTRAVEESHAKDIRYLERRVDDLGKVMVLSDEALEKLVDTRFAAQEQAVAIATEAMKERLILLNEFRAQMEDQSVRFATRDVLDTTFQDLNRRLGAIENKVGTWPTTADVDAKLATQINRIGSIEERLATLDGKLIAWSAAMGIGATLVAFLLQIFNIGG